VPAICTTDGDVLVTAERERESGRLDGVVTRPRRPARAVVRFVCVVDVRRSMNRTLGGAKFHYTDTDTDFFAAKRTRTYPTEFRHKKVRVRVRVVEFSY